MTLENKLNISDAVELARAEEKISKTKAAIGRAEFKNGLSNFFSFSISFSKIRIAG